MKKKSKCELLESRGNYGKQQESCDEQGQFCQDLQSSLTSELHHRRRDRSHGGVGSFHSCQAPAGLDTPHGCS